MHEGRPLTLQDWLNSATKVEYGQDEWYRAVLTHLICADGAHISVQAGDALYCTPRSNTGPWTHVEVGYPSVDPGPLWKDYGEDYEHPTQSVYAYVPVHLVQFFLAAHGGIDEVRTHAAAEAIRR
jgi:hypothetical protein